MKEVRKFRVTTVRQTCINHDWYTTGDIVAYNDILDYCRDCNNVDIFSLSYVAANIYNHSTKETTDDQGYDVKEIMEVLANNCCYTSIVDEEED